MDGTIGGLSLIVVGLVGIYSLVSIVRDISNKKQPRLWSILTFLLFLVLVGVLIFFAASLSLASSVRTGIWFAGVILLFVFLYFDFQEKDKNAYKIGPEYSYARERLKSHLGGENPEQVLDDVIRVIDEYLTPDVSRTIGPYNFVELTQYLADTLRSGIGAVKTAQRQTGMMAPILAGLKKLVLIHDCGVKESEIPDDVEKILHLNGPIEIDDVLGYLNSRSLR